MRTDSITETVAADHRKRLQVQAEANRLRNAGRGDRSRFRHPAHRLARVKLAEPSPLSFCVGG